MERVASALQDERIVQANNALELSNELRTNLATMSEARVTPLARKFLQEANTIKNKLIVEFGEDFEKQELVDELKGLADQLSSSGAWPTDEIGMGAIAFKNRCDEFRSTAIRESLSMLSNAMDEGGGQVESQLLSKISRLDATPLTVAFGFSEVARKVVRAAEKRASALESQFEGVDPQAETDEIHKQFKILLEKFDTFSNEGDAS